MKYFEVAFHVSPASETANDILAALLGEVGFETFTFSEDGLLGYVQQTLWNEDSTREVVDYFPLPDINITFDVKEAPDENWNAQWEESFAPIRIDDVACIHDTRYPADDEVRYDIQINPCQAFGTGSHQTTRMLVRALAAMDLSDKRVVDAGTGTGILGILCLMHGAADVYAYDIDEWSTRNAQENAALNGVDEHMTIALGDSAVLNEARDKDLVIANINRNILLADMPAFRRTMKTGAQLLLSGFYLEDIPHLLAKAEELDLCLVRQWNDEQWAALLLEANATSGVNL